MLRIVLTRTNLTIKLPYDIQKEYCSEEFESRYLKEEYNSKWKYNTEDGCTGNSPKYSLFSKFMRKILRRHTDKDSIITTHHEIDKDDIEKGKCTRRCEEMHEVSGESVEHTWKLMWKHSIEIYENAMIFDS